MTSTDNSYAKIFHLEEELEARSLALHGRDETIQALKSKIAEIYVELHNALTLKDELIKEADRHKFKSEKGRQDIERLFEQMRDISLINNTLVNDNNILKSRVWVLTDQIGFLRFANDKFSRDIGQVEHVRETVSSENEALKLRNNDLTNRDLVSSAKITHLEGNLTELLQRVDSMAAETETLKTANELTIRERDFQRSELAEKVAEYANLLSQNVKLEEELKEMRNLASELQSGKTMLKDQIEVLRGDNDELCNIMTALREENSHLSKRVEELGLFEDERPSLVNQMLALQTENERVIKTNGDLQQNIEKLQSVMAHQSTLKQEYEALQTKLENWECSWTASEANVVRLNQENEYLKHEIAKVNQGSANECQIVKSERDGLLQQVEDLQNARMADGDNMRQLETEIGQLREALCFAKTLQETLEGQISRLLSEQADADAKILNLQDEGEDLRSHLKKVQNLMDADSHATSELVSEKTNLENTVNQLNSYVASLESQMRLSEDTNRREAEDLRREREELEHQIAELNRAGEARVCQMSLENGELNQYVEQLKTSQESLCVQVKEMGSKLEEMDRIRAERDLLRITSEQMKRLSGDNSALNEHLLTLEHKNECNLRQITLLETEKCELVGLVSSLEERNCSFEVHVRQINEDYLACLREVERVDQDRRYLQECNDKLVGGIQTMEEALNARGLQIYELECANGDLSGQIGALRLRSAELETYLLQIKSSEYMAPKSEMNRNADIVTDPAYADDCNSLGLVSRSSGYSDQSNLNKPCLNDQPPTNFDPDYPSSDFPPTNILAEECPSTDDLHDDTQSGDDTWAKPLIDYMFKGLVSGLYCAANNHVQNYEVISAEQINIANVIEEIKGLLST